MNLEIREASRCDTELILGMIRGIAEYEKLLDQVETDAKILERELFDEKNARVILAFVEKQPVAFALYFYNFSTFKGKKGLYLEDLFVLPEYRGKGIGNSLFDYLVKQAKAENCGRMEWVCLDWNQPAIDFYKKKKAIPMSDWTIYRLDERYF